MNDTPPNDTGWLRAHYGCFTGDCPHDNTRECLEALEPHFVTLLRENYNQREELRRAAISDTPPNDTKYCVRNGQYVNRVSGEAIPQDEPVFLLRARDIHALSAIYSYMSELADPGHYSAVGEVIDRFTQFRHRNHYRMKEPDTEQAQEKADER